SVGEAAVGGLQVPVPGDPAVLLHRRVLDQQRDDGRVPHGALRLHRLHLHQVRHRARAVAARVRARADDGGELAKGAAALAGKSKRVLRAPDQPHAADPVGRAADHRDAAEHLQETRGGVPGIASKDRTTEDTEATERTLRGFLPWLPCLPWFSLRAIATARALPGSRQWRPG